MKSETLSELAREIGNAGYCNYAACEEFLQKAIELGRLQGLEEAAKIAEHFGNDELTPKELPPSGCVQYPRRFDGGLSKRFCDAVAAAIREKADG